MDDLRLSWCKPVESNHLPLAYRARPSPFGLACIDVDGASGRCRPCRLRDVGAALC